MKNQNIQTCECCGHIISERRISMYKGLGVLLFKIFKYRKEKGVHEFTRKDIKHLIKNENDTARLGDLVMFGGLVYKEKKARYGLNMERCESFFGGEYKIPATIWKNPVTGELRKEDYKTINELPKLVEFLNQDFEYVALYR